MPDSNIPELFEFIPLRELTLPFAFREISILVVKDPYSSLAADLGDPQHDIYWGDLWPAAVALADAIFDGSISIPEEAPILEIGCGSGLAALAAALKGARVIAADRELRALDLAKENARRNGVADRVHVEKINWSQPYTRKHRLIFAADCLYQPDGGWPLAAFIRDTLDPDPAANSRAIVVDPDRWTARNFKFLAQEAGLKVSVHRRKIPFVAGQGPVQQVPFTDPHAQLRQPIEATFYEMTL
jgi:predicted nicotinamide N-methyase